MLTNLNGKIDKITQHPQGSKTLKTKHKKRIIIAVVIIFILIIFPLIGILFGANQAAKSGKMLIAAYKNQNFDELKKNISATRSSVETIDMSLNFLFWLRVLPILGSYYADLQRFSEAGVEELKATEIIFKELEPYKQELGFKNQPLPGEDRVVQLAKILDKVIPNLDKVSGNLKKAAEVVDDINTKKYPESFNGFKVRENLTVARNFIVGANIAVEKAKPALELTPDALGLTSPKTYLLLFQNDKEIRPTGGFISAYAALKLDKGRISTTSSDDIYHLDERLLEVCKNKVCPLVPPDPIVRYLPEESGKARTAWSMRDSNISPDVPTAMKEFERMYQLLGEGLPFDGIILIDTQVVEELIDITGPIDILGTKYSAENDPRCNCPNVIYELESYVEIAAKGTADRKAILGVLMQQLMAKILGADVEKTPEFINTAVRLANHKHIIFFMHNEKLQQSLAGLEWTGQMKQFNGDYLHINDSNFAGGKSNLYVEQTVTQEISKDGDKIKKKLTIEYKNPQKFDRWLNGINRDYVRVYVPKGSKLISSKGSENKVNTIEVLDEQSFSLNKTVFEAFITVRPQNSRKLELEYEIPYNPKDTYDLLVQKQPGAKDFKYIIKLNGRQVADFELDMDKEFNF